jgi:hypothetical protein
LQHWGYLKAYVHVAAMTNMTDGKRGWHMKEEFALNRREFRRVNERKRYDAEVVFSHSGRIFKGIVKDISLGGAQIKTYSARQFDKGDIITVILPFTSGHSNIKRRGRIVWLNTDGFGIEFVSHK